MHLGVLGTLIAYWTIWILVLTVGISDGSNPLSTAGYSTTATLNNTGFSSSEIDSGGFFTGAIGIFTAMGRFIGLALFGVTDVLTGLPQIIFSAWQTAVTLFSIGFIVSAFWNG